VTGFQISAAEDAARRAFVAGDQRMRSATNKLEMHLATGSYHGFHIETIRFTGVVGLLAATAALIVFAVYAMRNIRHFRDDQHWGQVLFICMPFLIHPWWYWLIFGSYQTGFPKLIVQVGMLGLLESIRRRQAAAFPKPVSDDALGEDPAESGEPSEAVA
jgi:hypothetical protein